MTTTLTLEFDDSGVERMLHNTTSVLRKIIEPASKELAHFAAEAGREESTRLGAKWKITGTGAVERKVVAPEWWAHFIAGGTKPHGPRSAPFLVFEKNGEVIRATWVRGVTATHFDDKAVDRAKVSISRLVERIIQEASEL